MPASRTTIESPSTQRQRRDFHLLTVQDVSEIMPQQGSRDCCGWYLVRLRDDFIFLSKQLASTQQVTSANRYALFQFFDTAENSAWLLRNARQANP
jgi:hypothetical protein